MAQNGGRVPAWRRLGLALKNQDNTGVAVPESQTPSAPYSDQQISQDQAASTTEHAVDSQSSRLGKRKHQHELVDDHHQEPKKSRVAVPETQTNENAHPEIPEAATTASPNVGTAAEKGPVTGKPAKGGDSNYRKKKEKPPKRRKANQDVQQVASGPHTQHTHSTHAPAHSPEVTMPERPALLASTETDGAHAGSVATPQKLSKKPSRKDSSGSPPLTDRKKCVAFTPDTKKSDGNTGQDYFKAWVAQQKGTGEVSQPPEVSDFVLHALIADEEKTARKNGQLEKKQSGEDAANSIPKETKSQDKSSTKSAKTEEPKPVSTKTQPQSAPAAKGKKKDPAVYIAYLTQYYNDRENWKFNKAKQNDVVDNALNVFRIPIEHSEALTTYVAGLQGAGVIQRLRERCHATLNDLDEQDAKMDDVEARKVAQEEAEQERIDKGQKRRKTDGDITSLAEHQHSPGFIRRLQRRRAEALLNALSRAEPVAPAVTPKSSLNPLMQHVEAPKSNARKRKRRTEVSSDESSSDSSDSDSSSDLDSDSDDSDSDSDREPKKTDASSDESESDSSSSSTSDSSSDSDSDSDSD